MNRTPATASDHNLQVRALLSRCFVAVFGALLLVGCGMSRTPPGIDTLTDRVSAVYRDYRVLRHRVRPDFYNADYHVDFLLRSDASTDFHLEVTYSGDKQGNWDPVRSHFPATESAESSAFVAAFLEAHKHEGLQVVSDFALPRDGEVAVVHVAPLSEWGPRLNPRGAERWRLSRVGTLPVWEYLGPG